MVVSQMAKVIGVEIKEMGDDNKESTLKENTITFLEFVKQDQTVECLVEKIRAGKFDQSLQILEGGEMERR